MAKKNAGGGIKWKKRNAQVPFWAPWDKKRKHPATVEGVVVNIEMRPNKFDKKKGDAACLTVECADDVSFLLDTNTAGLRSLASVQKGESVRCEYKGEIAVKGRKMKMHDVDVYTAE